MPRLVITLATGEMQSWELRLGTTRVGRHPANDVQVEDLSVSTRHCELVWMDDCLTVRDCDSTNGTFLDGQPVEEARIGTGQRLRIGEVDVLIEFPETIVSVPEYRAPSIKTSIVLPDGTRSCSNHNNRRAAYTCSKCAEFFCGPCERMIRRIGGSYLKFCPSCGGACTLLPGLEQKKRNWLVNFLHKTLKLRPKP